MNYILNARLENEKIVHCVNGPIKSRGLSGEDRARAEFLYTYMIAYGECVERSIIVNTSKTDLWDGSLLNYHDQINSIANQIAYYYCDKCKGVWDLSKEETLLTYDLECPKCRGDTKVKKYVKITGHSGAITSLSVADIGQALEIKSPFKYDLSIEILKTLKKHSETSMKASQIGSYIDESHQRIGIIISKEALIENKLITRDQEGKFKITSKGIDAVNSFEISMV